MTLRERRLIRLMNTMYIMRGIIVEWMNGSRVIEQKWYSRISLKPLTKTEEIITEEPALKKKSKKGEDKKTEYQENDEHEGMDMQSLIAHEQHTKFKTID